MNLNVYVHHFSHIHHIFVDLKKRVPNPTGGMLKLFQWKTVWGIVWIRKWYHLIALHSENVLSTWFDVIQHLKNFLQLPEVWKVIKNQHFPRFQSPIFTFEGSIKTKKSPSAYVFANKTYFRCHAIMLFISASTYDHEEVFTNLLWHYHCSRKFLRHLKSSVVIRK